MAAWILGTGCADLEEKEERKNQETIASACFKNELGKQFLRISKKKIAIRCGLGNLFNSIKLNLMNKNSIKLSLEGNGGNTEPNRTEPPAAGITAYLVGNKDTQLLELKCNELSAYKREREKKRESGK